MSNQLQVCCTQCVAQMRNVVPPPRCHTLCRTCRPASCLPASAGAHCGSWGIAKPGGCVQWRAVCRSMDAVPQGRAMQTVLLLCLHEGRCCYPCCCCGTILLLPPSFLPQALLLFGRVLPARVCSQPAPHVSRQGSGAGWAAFGALAARAGMAIIVALFAVMAQLKAQHS